jgi:hypothetical protein
MVGVVASLHDDQYDNLIKESLRVRDEAKGAAAPEKTFPVISCQQGYFRVLLQFEGDVGKH